MSRLPKPENRVAWCSVCDRQFTAWLSDNGRYPRTCSLECRVTAMRRFAQALLDKAGRLEAGDE